MKSLFEIVGKKTAVFTFGRMNPPTNGHEKLIQKVLNVAAQKNATPFVFVSHTQDAKKNPLSHKQKIKYLRLGIPSAEKHIVSENSVKTPFDALKYVEMLGYTNVIMVVGSDRIPEFKKSISPYINHPDPSKSFNLNSFELVSAGDRDPDADGVAGISASKMKEAATKNDFATFRLGAPSKLSQKYVKEMFDEIRKNMSVIEMTEEIQKLKKSLNIPRNKMPQIRRDDIPDFIKSLKKKGIDVHMNNKPVGTLNPTQNEINLDKVKEKYTKFVDGKEPKPFIVSYDNYVLDGHHQLFALITLDKDLKVPCFVIGLSMKDLLKYAHDFPKVKYKTIAD